MFTLRRFFFFYLFLSLLCSCSSQQEKTAEGCVRQYAQFINQGKLEDAKKMCTPAGQAFLNALGEIITASASPTDSSEIKIKSISCLTSKDTTFCTSVEYDGFEESEKKYCLIKTKTGWLIDRPLRESSIKNREEILEKEGE